MAADPYLDGLKMLARLELSEARLRQRLARRGHNPDGIDRAVARLREERALDDARAAAAIARRETTIKRRGKLRVRLQIERAGIEKDVARHAVEEVFAAIDDDALLQTSLARRLRGGRLLADDAEFARLFRYLVGQGFESDRVMKALDARRRR